MKSLLSVITASCLFLLFSCKKDHVETVSPTPKNLKKYAVSFGVSTFSQTVTHLSLKPVNRQMSAAQQKATTDSLAGTISNLVYLVYDAGGNEVSRIREFANTPGTGLRFSIDYGFDSNMPYHYSGPFGTIQDSLAAGTYTVVIVGSAPGIINVDDPLSINNRNEEVLSLEFDPLSTANVQYTRGLDDYPRTIDTFFKKFRVTIGSQNVDQEIALDRIVGKIEVNVEDALPANVSYYKLFVYDDLGAFLFCTETPFDQTFYDIDPIQEAHPIDPSYLGKPNFKAEHLVLNTIQALTVEIDFYDAGDHLLSTRTINNVSVSKNKVTVLTGKAFDKIPNAQFNILLNQNWDGDVNVHF
jgi:hypothetical protein